MGYLQIQVFFVFSTFTCIHSADVFCLKQHSSEAQRAASAPVIMWVQSIKQGPHGNMVRRYHEGRVWLTGLCAWDRKGVCLSPNLSGKVTPPLSTEILSAINQYLDWMHYSLIIIETVLLLFWLYLQIDNVRHVAISYFFFWNYKYRQTINVMNEICSPGLSLSQICSHQKNNNAARYYYDNNYTIIIKLIKYGTVLYLEPTNLWSRATLSWTSQKSVCVRSLLRIIVTQIFYDSLFVNNSCS